MGRIPRPGVTNYVPGLDESPCECTQFKIEAVKRQKTTPICCAKSRRYNGAVLCLAEAHRKIAGYGNLCTHHEDLLRDHKSCAHCQIFPDSTLRVIMCSEGHLTHLSCGKRFSPPGTFLCSHCNERQAQPTCTEEMIVATTKPKCFAAKRVSTWKEWKECMGKLLSCGHGEDAARTVAQILDCHIDGPVPLNPLYEAIDCHAVSVIEALRFLGASVTLKLMYDKVQWMDHEIFSALQMDPLFGDSMLSSIINQETVFDEGSTVGIVEAVQQLSIQICVLLSTENQILFEFTFVSDGRLGYISLLKTFDQTGVDLSIRSEATEKTLRAMCESAPCSVQESLLKASTRFDLLQRPRRRKNIIVEDLAHGRERFPVRVVNDVDEFSPDDFECVTRVRDTCDILKNRKQVEMLNCWCKDRCNSECPCCSNVYDNHGRIQDVDVAFIECSSDCMCSMRCGNRVAQKGAIMPIEVFKSDNGRGWAVRALADIKHGSFIGEYTGDLLTDSESEERIDNYFFETNVGEETYTVDARLYGNFTRFINHSCKPNAKVTLVIWDWHAEQLNHLCIFAAENIYKNQEITISYGDHWWNSKMPEIHCLCGAPECKFSSNSYIENGSLGSSSTSSCSDDSPQ